MLQLNTKSDLQRLVDDKLLESLTLEYKASAALGLSSTQRDELCKDVSAMANSAGGQIIYGIAEDRQGAPNRLDDGVDASISKEWIEQVLGSRLQPRIDGLVIAPIQLSSDRFAFVITVPQASSRGPHQAPDKKYYKRHNFQSVPMEDYEIRDVMHRAELPDLEITFGFPDDAKQARFGLVPAPSVTLTAEMRNLSDAPAEYLVGRIYLDGRLGISSLPSPTAINVPWLEQKLWALPILREPGAIPIFRENPTVVATITFSPTSTFPNLEGVLLTLAYEIRARGFVARRKSTMLVRAGHLFLPAPADWSDMEIG